MPPRARLCPASIPPFDLSVMREADQYTAKFQNNLHWHDSMLFYEYFHGDGGAGRQLALGLGVYRLIYSYKFNRQKEYEWAS